MAKKDELRLHELFVELRNDDKNALEKIYNEYKGLIYKIAFSILKDSNDSDDVVQNVICRIFKLEKSKLPTKKELSWIYSVTKNESCSFYKLKNKNVNIDDIYIIKSDLIDESDDIIYYNEIIKKLKPIDQEIVSLKIISDLSFKTISKILNMPISTIEWRYYKSIKYIRKSIITSIILAISFIKLNSNYNQIKDKESEIKEVISRKEKELNNVIENQVFNEDEYADVIPNEEFYVQNTEIYDIKIKNINDDIQKIYNNNILMNIFVIILIISLFIQVIKYIKLIKIKK